MKWVKKGLIYKPDFDKKSWKYSSALVPTPILLNEEVIRVYFTARDIDGVGRGAYVDLNSQNPSEIIKVSQNPVLDIGQPGCFDDNGVLITSIVSVQDLMRLYYVGYQKVEKVKFLAFSGIAESIDGGESFTRISNVPALDRAEEGIYIRCIESAFFEQNVWKVWYLVGNQWNTIDKVPYPNYYIKYCESKDGLTFPKEGSSCLKHQDDEYRLALPRVYKTPTGYEMYYTIGRLDKSYLPGRAVSSDGINWTRVDDTVGIHLSEEGWDSQTLCYPSLLKVRDKTYMFYNGNNMGFEGFGYAILSEE